LGFHPLWLTGGVSGAGLALLLWAQRP